MYKTTHTEVGQLIENIFLSDESIDANRDSIKKRYAAVRAVDIVIASLITLFGFGLVFMIIRRKDLQPIKVKGWRLILLSLVGNTFIIAGQLFVKVNFSFILEDNELNLAGKPTNPTEDVPLEPSTIMNIYGGNCLAQDLEFCFFFPLFIIPYFLRAIRLITIFKQHKKYVLKKRRNGVVAFKRIESSYCVGEATLAFWLIIILVALLALFCVNVADGFDKSYLIPSYNLGQCLPTSTLS